MSFRAWIVDENQSKTIWQLTYRTALPLWRDKTIQVSLKMQPTDQPTDRIIPNSQPSKKDFFLNSVEMGHQEATIDITPKNEFESCVVIIHK